MLKINKILSKKIKFPLSLRGAKRRSNLSGFSLIELMVAVAILAIAIFGIFHAYSVGFMGMADARDRTVATNLAQKKIEDVKNIPFVDIDDYISDNNGEDGDGTTEKISGKNFIIKMESEIYVEEPDTINLIRLTTEVKWPDRNGNLKMVVTETVIYNNDS